MILPYKKVLRITNNNLSRCYLAIQNMDTVATNFIYLLQQEAEPEVFKNQGLQIGGYGMFEMQNCLSNQSKKEWFAYCEKVGGIDIRVMDV